MTLVVGQLASAAGSLVLLVESARILGTSGRGVFAFFLLWPGLGAYLLTLGIPGANLKLAASEEIDPGRLVGGTLVFTALVAAIVTAGLAIGLPHWLTGPMSTSVAWLAGTAVVLAVAFNGITWTMMGLGEYLVPMVLRGVIPLGCALVFGLALLFGGDGARTVTVAAASYAGCIGAAAAYSGWCLRGRGRVRVELAALRRMIGFGVRYQAGLVAQLVTFRADQWVLGDSARASSLGLYSVAVSVSEVATYAASALGMTKFRDAARGKAAAVRRTIALTVLSTVASAALVGVVGVVAIPLVFGLSFKDAIEPLLILLPGTIGIGLLRVCGNELSGRERPGLVSLIAGVQAIVTVSAFVVFIPRYGMNAAALCSSVGYLMGGVASALAALRLLGGATVAGGEAAGADASAPPVEQVA